jgi:hypothetical protein
LTLLDLNAPAVDWPRSVSSFSDREVKILQPVRLQHPKHVRELFASDIDRQVERKKTVGAEKSSSVRRLRLHGCRSKDKTVPGHINMARVRLATSAWSFPPEGRVAQPYERFDLISKGLKDNLHE